MRVTLRNTFHGTSCTVEAEPGQTAADAWLDIVERGSSSNCRPKDRRRYLRVQRALCGIEGCKCGVVRE